MDCSIILIKTEDMESADKLAEILLKKNLVLYVDAIETNSYSKTSVGTVEKQDEFMLIAKTSQKKISEAKQCILHHITFEKGDLVIVDAADKSTRIDLLLSKL